MAAGALNALAPSRVAPHNKALLARLGCKACPLDKADLCTPKMPATINQDAAVFVLGEAPEQYDDEQTKKPFTGKIGRILRDCLPESCSFENTINCYPGKRAPTPNEIECCRPRVTKSIEEAKPLLILGLGLAPLQSIMGTSDMAGMRGRVFAVKIGSHSCWLMPTYSPSYILEIARDKAKPLQSMYGHALRMDVKKAFELVETLEYPILDTEKDVRIGIQCFDGSKSTDFVQLMSLFERAMKAPIKAIDIETQGLHPWATEAAILTAAISFEDVNFSFALHHPKARWGSYLSLILKALKKLIMDDTIKIAHNVPYEVQWFSKEFGPGSINHTVWHCTMMQAHFLDERKGSRFADDNRASKYQALDFLVKQYFGISYKSMFKLDKKNMSKADLGETLIYNGADTKYTLRLFHQQDKFLEERGLLDAYLDSTPRQPTVGIMQHLGVNIDQKACKRAQKQLESEIEKLHAQVIDQDVVKKFIADRKEFNPASNHDVLALFKDYLKCKEVEIKDKSGKDRLSVDKNILDKIEHPLADLIVKLRNRSKLKSTYVDEFEAGKGSLIFPDGKIHSNFNTTFTETGRLSSDEPNCFPPDVEILTEIGWVTFGKLDKNKNSNIAQYDLKTKEISFAQPLDYIEMKFSGDLKFVSTEQQINIICTPDHTLYLKRKNENSWVKCTPSSYMKSALQPQAGFYAGGRIKYSENQLICLAALQADASITKDGHIDWGFSKKRKITRLRQALISCGIVYSEYVTKKGNARFYVSRKNIPDWLTNRKVFGSWILDLDKESFLFLAKEIWFWDGCYSRQSMYSSNEKINADWVQILTCLSGRRARQRLSSTSVGNAHWFVEAGSNDYSHTANHTVKDVPYTGAVYCVTMPKGTILIRYKNTVSIVGNCQNFPKRADAWVRGQIAPPPGYVLVAVDYGQLEACTVAMCSKDKYLVKALWEDYDTHAEWARRTALKCPELIGGKVNLDNKDIMKKFRSLIKNKLTFPAFFGASSQSVRSYLHNATGYDVDQGIVDSIMDDFWNCFSGTAAWQKQTMKQYYDIGYVETLVGRRHHYPLTKNQAINMPVQGSAAELVCNAMNKLSQIAVETGIWYLHPVMNIHDDLSLFLPEDPKLFDEALEIIAHAMLVFDYNWINVPLSIEISVGKNWADVKPLTKLWSHREYKFPKNR